MILKLFIYAMLNFFRENNSRHKSKFYNRCGLNSTSRSLKMNLIWFCLIRYICSGINRISLSEYRIFAQWEFSSFFLMYMDRPKTTFFWNYPNMPIHWAPRGTLHRENQDLQRYRFLQYNGNLTKIFNITRFRYQRFFVFPKLYSV